EAGSLYNLRAPLAAVVSYHASYTVNSPPTARMEYDHTSMAGNPLILMIFMFLVSILTIKLPKALAKENDKERVSQLHLGILIAVILFWLFYVLGGNAYLVWILGIALTVGAYGMAHMIYVRGWRGMAISSEGLYLGEGIEAVDPVNGSGPPAGPVAQGPAILGTGGAGVDPHPSEEVMVVMPTVDEEAVSEPAQPVDQTPAYVTPPPQPQVQSQAVPTVQPSTANQGPAPSPVVTPEPVARDTKTMRCRCGGKFRVPLQPRPLEVQCPHCGVTGTLKD
ncbi:MAG: hypothetical protein GWN18_10050, partial [Thermoplasmata archaeon]|nr:hypothetical protein [Thermoplasmata archaeon]NIS20307.1 hypothetical protein [Thermoplasmata archaeon]NIT77649.1 hypothetical protein [Thermoplasmata archaeon]NIU49395.1 hypothetical protein [Thermoplasmata archaeon]NIV79067.1 hypothetical protein [Thermoplasmata archaeon]